jgi:branched-chain amino acid transport system permease protein
MGYFAALIVEGALAGTIYALIALAFVLVYRASRMINFALGEWIMIGALLAGLGAEALALGGAGAIAFAVAVMAMFGALAGHLVLRRLLGRPAISALMVTLGIGMVLRGAAPLLFAGTPALLPPAMLGVPITIAGLAVPADKLAAAAVALPCTALVAWFFGHSRTGLAVRAISDDVQMAGAVGIDVERQLMIVWALTGAVAVVAGVLWVWVAGSGFGVALIGLKVLPIVIVGGLESVAGTIVAAVAIGVLESLGSGYLDELLGSGFGGLVPYLAAVAVLASSPHGLFGHRRVERV